MPPSRPLMRPNSFDFGGGKNSLAATLPHCRGKLRLKHLELATACDAFQESRGQPRVVVRPGDCARHFWALVYLYHPVASVATM
jgi:hypothetical protein